MEEDCKGPDLKAKIRKKWGSVHKETVKTAKTKYVETVKGKTSKAQENAERPR